MPTHTVGLTYKTDAGAVPISAVPITTDTEVNESILVPAGAVNKEVDVTFAHAVIQSYCLSLLTAASVGKSEAATGQLTLKWNSTGTPAPAMTLNAKQPIWHAPNFGTTNLFSADVTKVYISNPGTVDLYLGVHVALNDAV